MAEVLHGNASGDQLNARNDKTQLYGLKGNDTLTSDNKSDVLIVGGSGDDSLIMSGGNGTLSGGEGHDTFELTYSATKKLSAIIEDLDPVSDKIIVNYEGNTAPQLTNSVNGNDVIFRDGDGLLSVTLKGVHDNDYFDGNATDNAWKVLELTNAEREAQGLSPLTMSEGLTAGAQIRADEITEKGKIGLLTDHTRLDNETSWLTVLDEIGKSYSNVGENLDGGARYPEDVVYDWMTSTTGHREILLNATYKKIGIGYNEDDPDPTNHRWYWTQWFADSLTSPETVNVTNATVEVHAVSKSITLTEGDDTYDNPNYSATIAALGGNDFISNAKPNVSISGGANNDTVDNSGLGVTIYAGEGDDSIRLSTNALANVIEYAAGDGNDTVYGVNSTDTVSISGNEYDLAIVDNDIVVSNGTNSVLLLDAARSGVQVIGTKNNLIIGTDGFDDLENSLDSAVIAALGGNDLITNIGSRVSISGGDGSDNIKNGGYLDGISYDGGSNVNISGDNGDDKIFNENGDSVTIDGGSGNDSIENDEGYYLSIDGGSGNDSITNRYGYYITINGGEGDDYISGGFSVSGGAGNDYINNYINYATIDGGDGNDSISNRYADNVSINTGAGDDAIFNNRSDNVTIRGGDGNDTISYNAADTFLVDGGDGNDTIMYLSDMFEGLDGYRYGQEVTLDGGAGNDYIYNKEYITDGLIVGDEGNDTIQNDGNNMVIDGGYDNDMISLSDTAKYNWIFYMEGYGRDVVSGFNDDDSIIIGFDDTDTYSTVKSDDNVIVKVGMGFITLLDAASLSTVNIAGTLQELEEEDYPITLTEGDDTYTNYIEGATILALGGNDSVDNAGDNTTIDGGAGDDSIRNIGFNVAIYTGDDADYIYSWSNNVTIDGGSGNDEIYNEGSNISINGDSGDDYIGNAGSNVTIKGGLDNDFIFLTDYAQNNVIEYAAGDGNDTVLGFKSTDSLRISNDKFTRSIVGDDVIINVDGSDESILLVGAASLGASINVEGIRNANEDSKLITLTDGNDTYSNSVDGATIQALGGNDSVTNHGASVSIDGGADDDYIHSYGISETVTVEEQTTVVGAFTGIEKVVVEQKTIVNVLDTNNTIDGGTGNDTIENSGKSVTINGGTGNDYIFNDDGGDSVTIDGGTGDDTIYNYEGFDVTINGGDGNDSIKNGRIVSESRGLTQGNRVTIDGGNGDDTIENEGLSVSINGGAGNDYISDHAPILAVAGINVVGRNTINAGAGDDQIRLSGLAVTTFIQYNVGDGNDTIWGLGNDALLRIDGGIGFYKGSGTSIYSTVVSGDDVIVTVGEGSLTLKNHRGKPLHIIIGESGTSGGGSDSGGDGNDGGGGGSSSGSGDGGRGGSGGGNTSGGTSASEGRGSDASGGRSASGSRGRGTSTSTDTGGSNVRVTTPSGSSSKGGGSRIAAANSTDVANFMNALMPSTQQTAETQPVANQRIYAGDNQVISDYHSGEKILFGAVYTGSFYDGAGNYCVGSSTGALVIQNAVDKVIDLSDGAGNAVIKSYAASTAGIIDGRGLTGFELINGSAGEDAIFAGDGGSQLWGGADVVQDIMVGGGGTDIFIGGRTQGADIFFNASSADIVHLNDATLSDIIATEENNGAIAIAFNTGNAVAIQSSEVLSATFMLADGSAYRYNHSTKNWQNA